MKPEAVLAVGFCPFCRESYEGLARCPAHDLVLVAWDALPPDADREPDPLEPFSLGHGRWIVLVGAALLLIGFFMPVLAVGEGTLTGLLLANDRAANAWIIPACALGAAATVLRRRTPAKLRGARFVVVFFGVVVLTSLVWTARAIVRGADAAELVVAPLAGTYVVLAAVALLFASPFVLGRQVESGR